jgi:hypothetical protein
MVGTRNALKATRRRAGYVAVSCVRRQKHGLPGNAAGWLHFDGKSGIIPVRTGALVDRNLSDRQRGKGPRPY